MVRRFLFKGAKHVSQLEQDVVAWNIELESNFCYIDPQRLLILGYNATYGDNSAYKNETTRIRNRRFPSRRYLSDHARRYRHVMKMLGEDQSIQRNGLTNCNFLFTRIFRFYLIRCIDNGWYTHCNDFTVLTLVEET